MRKILCIWVAMAFLLAACAPSPQSEASGTAQGSDQTSGAYVLTFSVAQLSGWPSDAWDFVYTYGGETVLSGHRIEFPPDLFSFSTIQVDVIEKDAPGNVFSATFPVAICDGGFGETEVAVTGSDGRTASFRITCQVAQAGKR